MNIAFLFNSDHPSLEWHYGYAVMNKVLKTGILQGAARSVRVSVGDIPTFSAAASSNTPTKKFHTEVCHRIYQTEGLDLLIRDRLEDTYSNETVYCWLIQNLNEATASELSKALTSEPSFLGAMELDFSISRHLAGFRNSLIEKYRFHGKSCSVFYGMGFNSDIDITEREYLEGFGYVVEYEDIGARRSIFDNFDTVDHFQRVKDFKRIFARFNNLGSDVVSDLALHLEELNPKLFDAFAAAARVMNRSETKEECAQAALSGRRLLEQLADYLYPPRKEKVNGREVGTAKYKNRIWAFIEVAIEDTTMPELCTVKELGEEGDRLANLFNKGVHFELTKPLMEEGFYDLAIWIAKLVAISPKSFRNPYLAYTSEILGFEKKASGESDC